MTRHTVLITDPEEARSRLIDKALKKFFDVEVLSVRQSQLAIALFRSRRPWVCLTSAVQNRHDGFRLCGALRHLPGGERATMIVYGSLGEDVEHRDLASEHRISSWIPAPDAGVLGRLLEPHLSARIPVNARAAVPESFSQKVEQFSARVPGTEDEPWVEPDPTPVEEKEWSDLLRSDVSVASLRTAMTKSIHVGATPPDVNEVEAPKELSWSQLARADLKGATLKALLTKEIRLRKKEPGKGKGKGKGRKSED